MKSATRRTKKMGDSFMRLLMHVHGWQAKVEDAWLTQTMAAALADLGHEVDVAVTSIDASATFGPFDSGLPGVRAFNIPGSGWLPRKVSRLQALARARTSRALRSWLAEYEALLVHTPAILTGGLAHQLKKSGIVDQVGMFMWDFFPQIQLDFGDGVWLKAHRPLHMIEERLMSAVDIAFPMSPRGRDFTRDYFHRPDLDCVIVPPWGADMDVPVALTEPVDTFRVVWGGRFTPGRAVGDLLTAAHLLRDTHPDIVFHLAGDGPYRHEWGERAKIMGLTNVVFEGHLTRLDYHALLSSADLAVSVIAPGSTPSFPSKTVDYAVRGLPVIAAVEDENDYGRILERAGLARVCRAGDAEALAVLIASVARGDSPLNRNQMALNSRKFFEQELDVRVAAQRVADALR